MLSLHGLLKGVRVGPRYIWRHGCGLLQSNCWLWRHGSRDIEIAPRLGRRGLLANGGKSVPVGHRRFVDGLIIAAKHGVQRLVLVGQGLSWGALGVLSGTPRRGWLELLVWRGHCGIGERREVARTVAKLVLDGERGQSAHATASPLLLLEALRQQASLEGQGVQGRERGRHLAGARAGEVVQREARHAGVGGRVGEGAEFEAAGAVWSVYHGGGRRSKWKAHGPYFMKAAAAEGASVAEGVVMRKGGDNGGG